jgi:uncharacterized membrane protein YgdD (TMEM256/DUF423 family)
LGALLAAAAVGLGAFGAHGLKARLSHEMLAVWQTAVQYHAWHALGLLAIGLSPDAPWTRAAGWLLVLGIVLFSGSLYSLALGAPKPLGAVTPIGGLAFILGWIAFAIGVIYARTA